MRWICFWCCVVGVVVTGRAQEDGYYAPQTFTQHVVGPGPSLFRPMHRPWDDTMRIPNRLQSYQKGLFTPASANDVTPQGSIAEGWRPTVGQEGYRGASEGYRQTPAPVVEPWREGAGYSGNSIIPKADPWRLPYPVSKEQQATILHHKQALTSDCYSLTCVGCLMGLSLEEGAFRYEYASDNGLAAGEVIEPDGSRVGAYQYKDPSGQIVKLKYRAGKDGFQILEGSHLPKSPEPVQPPTQENHYQQAYEQQRRQYELQQQYNQAKPSAGRENQGLEDGQRAAGQQYTSWRPQAGEDDGQYRENDLEDPNKPHTFGEGYAFSFEG